MHSQMTYLDTVRKLKWNDITFKKGDSVVLIGLYSYELAYLINNSNKQAIILEWKERKNERQRVL